MCKSQLGNIISRNALISLNQSTFRGNNGRLSFFRLCILVLYEKVSQNLSYIFFTKFSSQRKIAIPRILNYCLEIADATVFGNTLMPP